MALNQWPLDASQVLQSVYDTTENRLRVDTEATVIAGAMEVAIDAATDSIRISDGTDTLLVNADGSINSVVTATDLDIRNLAHTIDSIAIGDGTDFLVVNADGSINVNVTSSTPVGDVVSTFGSVSSVASATLTTIASYTVPIAKTAYLERIEVSGTNIAQYEVYINSILVDRLRTYFGGNISTMFDFSSNLNRGLKVNTTIVIEVKVIHSRPNVGDFDARIQVVEV